ncbi:MAG: glycosyltransferase family 39 protein [Patescibacteria group bacterium]|jgi:4-amino-4-deoxy-L-arabinose transferase-like glycosyltransferase
MMKWSSVREWAKKERVILMICLAAFLLTIVYSFGYHIQPIVDAKAYDKMAVNIAEGRGFRLVLDVPIDQDDVITYQGPLFQYFLAGIYKTVGHHIPAVWIMHALLRALTVYLIYATCVRLFGKEEKKIGWIAAGFIAFYPDLIEMSAMVMTETLFIFFTALVLYFFSRVYQKATYADVAAFAATLGFATLTRSTILAFWPFFIFLLFRKKAWPHMVLFFIVLAAVLTPWTVRNYKIYNTFLPTMANFGYNLIVGNRVGHDGEGGAPPELPQLTKDLGVIGANVYGVNYFKTFLREHPGEYVRLVSLRTMKYFSPIRPLGFWFYQTGWKQLVFVLSSSLMAFLIFVAGWAGLFLAWKKKNAALGYLFCFALVTAGPVIAILVETRYRIPIYPFMAIFGGYSIANWLKDRKAVQPYFYGALALVLSIGLIDLSFEYQKVLRKINGIFGR